MTLNEYRGFDAMSRGRNAEQMDEARICKRPPRTPEMQVNSCILFCTTRAEAPYMEELFVDAVS
jgi:hypothetical protein